MRLSRRAVETALSGRPAVRGWTRHQPCYYSSWIHVEHRGQNYLHHLPEKLKRPSEMRWMEMGNGGVSVFFRESLLLT